VPSVRLVSSTVDAAPPAALSVVRGDSSAPDTEAQTAPTVDPSAQKAALVHLAAGGEEQSFVDAFEQVWTSSWTDEKAHRSLATRAQLEDRLALLGRCYKTVRERAPDDEMAKAGQDRVLTLAMASLTPLGETPRRQGAPMMKVAAIGVAVVIMAVAAAWIVRSLQSLQPG